MKRLAQDHTNLHKVTQYISGRTEIQTQYFTYKVNSLSSALYECHEGHLK